MNPTVYRHYDKFGNLLYVGCTTDPETRLSGHKVTTKTINIREEEGEDDSLGQDDMQVMKQTLQQVLQSLNKMAGQLQKNSQDIQALDQQEQDLKTTIGHLSTLAEQVKKLSEDHRDFRDNHSQMVNDINKRLVESIAYKDAPPTIQRQMEMQAGFKPAPDHERDLEPATNGNGK